MYKTHVQKIRSKFYIPLLAGSQPPNINFFNVNNTTFSTLSESNQAEARRCALYYMTLLTPWTLQTNLNRNKGELIPIYGTSWNDFTNHMQKLNGMKNN